MVPNHVSQWSEMRFGEILTYLDEQVSFDEMAEYITITVKRRHGGLEARESLFGHEIKTKKQYRLHPGAFIISRVQCWHAAFAIVPDDIPKNMIASQNYDQFKISSKVDKRFFWWLSHSPAFIETVRSSASGVVIEKMVFNRDTWLQKAIPLPPLDDQRRIVGRIEALTLSVTKAQTLRREAIIETNFLLRRAVTGLLANGRFEYQPLKNVLAEPLQNGLSIPASGIGQEGVLFTKVGIVNSGKMNPNETKRVNIDLVKDSTFWMKQDDVFVSRGNSLELVGSAAVYEGQPENCAFSDLLIRIRVKKTAIDPHYLVYYIRSAEARKYIESEASGTSPSMKKISQPKLEKMQIPVPSLDEQQHIVTFLDGLQAQVEDLRRLQAESQKELDALMPSILDRAFKGEL